MPTATLTWSDNHGDSNPQSNFSATNQGAIQLMNQYFTALAAFSDFPWTVCSFEGTTAPWYVTLKRKSNAPGRILIMAVASAPNSTYNPQLGNLVWTSAGVRAAFFKNATTDTPANLLATSGDVFTNPSGSSGLGTNVGFNDGSATLRAWACEDGIAFRVGTTISTTEIFAIGDLLESATEDSAPMSACFAGGTITGTTPQTSPVIGSHGVFSSIGGNLCHFGAGWVPPSAIFDNLRNSGTKQAWFLPRSVCSYQLPLGEALSYKLRQITIGPTPLASFETLTDTGSVLRAISTAHNTSTGVPWLTNFKV